MSSQLFISRRQSLAKSEEVIRDREANRLLRDADRGYRCPFAIPDKF
jgi:hypothetical protein